MKQIRTYLICAIALILLEFFFLAKNGIDVSKSALGLSIVTVVFILKALQLTIVHEKKEANNKKAN